MDPEEIEQQKIADKKIVDDILRRVVDLERTKNELTYQLSPQTIKVLKDVFAFITVSVTVSAASSSGTVEVKEGSTIVGYYPTGNQDQFVDDVSISSTTLIVTLASAATADNTYNIMLMTL